MISLLKAKLVPSKINAKIKKELTSFGCASAKKKSKSLNASSEGTPKIEDIGYRQTTITTKVYEQVLYLHIFVINSYYYIQDRKFLQYCY